MSQIGSAFLTSVVKITQGAKEYLPAATTLLSAAFKDDPVITYLLHTLKPSARFSYLPSYFRALLTAASLNNAIFYEASDWSCCGVLMPPESRVDNPWTLIQAGFLPMLWNIGLGGCKRMLGEFSPLADACKAKGLKGEKRYYYVFFIATKEEERGKGLCPAMIKQWQDLASRDQVPIWLEATTALSASIYRKLGFETVDQIVLGEGKIDENGNKCKGGKGVKKWGMIWRPKPLESSTV